MRIRFDDAMSESNSLILHEWKAMGTARRLQENNDQLLELLLDFNDQARVNPRLRYDLRALSAADTAVPTLEPVPDPALARRQLQALRDGVADGTMTADEYAARADTLHRAQALQHTLTSLASLEATVPHTTPAVLPARDIDGIDLTDHAPGYMSPAHEDEYLLATDQVLAEPGFDPALQHGRPLRLPSAQPPLSEKDLTVRNPDSVYNWLRKHQPQVFLQDKDAAVHHENLSEKSAPKSSNAGGKKVKRESAIGGAAGAGAGAGAANGTPGPRDHDDDDSAAQETAKGRRRTGGGGGAGGDDDTAYRPKGGSSRPSKRKREDGDTPVPKSRKKNRPSTSVPG